MDERVERMRRRRLRALRGAAASAIAVLFASTAHTLSGGDAPPPWLVLAITLLAAPLCMALIGRRRSVVRLAASVGSAQVALHAAFAAVGSATPSVGLGAPGHVHDTAAVLGMLGGMPADHATATMTFGHLLAAIATVAVLAWGERLAAAIARGIRRLLRLDPVTVALQPAAVPGAPIVRLGGIVAAFLECVTRRGPPARRAPALAV